MPTNAGPSRSDIDSQASPDGHVSSCSGSHIGPERSENQDRVLVDAESCVYVVCDGMGGAPDGAKAAEIASQATMDFVLAASHVDEATMIEAVWVGSQAVLEAQTLPVKMGTMGSLMGTTILVAALASDGDRMVGSWVGDSLAFASREDGSVRSLVKPHEGFGGRLSMVAGLPYPKGELSSFDVRLTPGVRVVLTSDGVTNYADPCVVEELVATPPSEVGSTVSALRLLEAAYEGAVARDASGDNASVIVIDPTLLSVPAAGTVYPVTQSSPVVGVPVLARCHGEAWRIAIRSSADLWADGVDCDEWSPLPE